MDHGTKTDGDGSVPRAGPHRVLASPASGTRDRVEGGGAPGLHWGKGISGGMPLPLWGIHVRALVGIIATHMSQNRTTARACDSNAVDSLLRAGILD